MRRTLALFALVCVFSLSASAQQAGMNRYGMKLQVSGSDTTVVKASSYEALGIDLYSLPGVLKPYAVDYTCLDEASIESVKGEDIVYKTYPDGRELHIMVYRSANPKSPVVFQIHGGAWYKGDYASKGMARVLKTLAGKYGITTVSIQYSFASVKGITMEDTIQDCYDAVQYVLDRSREFGINPRRIGFMGQSAGGHLAACCALHFKNTRALAGHYGAYDLVKTIAIYDPSGDVFFTKFPDYFHSLDTDYMNSVSPAFRVTRSNARRFAANIYAGTADITVPCAVSLDFVDILRAAGNKKVTLHLYDNVTHAIGYSHCGDDMFSSTINLFLSELF